MYVVWREIAPHSSVALQKPIEDALATSRDFLDREHTDQLNSIRSAVAENRSPHYETVREMDRSLQLHCPHEFQVLQAYAHESTGNCARVFAELTEQLLTGQEAFIVLASESSIGDSADPRGDRYLNILQCALERVGVELARTERSGRHTVDVNVASRDVNDPILGRTRLSQQRLSSVCSAAKPAQGDVFLIAASVSPFNAETDPGIVMADMVSNYLWGEVLRSPTLAKLRKRSIEYFSLTLDAGAPALPQASATGIARVAIDTSREFDVEGGLGNASPWVSEQAAAWIAYSGGSR